MLDIGLDHFPFRFNSVILLVLRHLVRMRVSDMSARLTGITVRHGGGLSLNTHGRHRH